MGQLKAPREIHAKVFEITLALYRVTDFFPTGEVLRKNIREKANEIFGSITEYGHSPAPEQEATAVMAKIASMRGFLAIARSLRLVNPVNISVLEREYGALADFFNREFSGENSSDQEGNKARTERLADSQGGVSAYAEPLSTWDDFSTAQHNGHQLHIGQKNEFKRTDGRGEAVKEKRNNKTEFVSISDVFNTRQKKILDQLKKQDQASISDFYSFFSGISSKTIQRDLQDLVSRNMLKKEGEKRWTTYSLRSVR